MPFTAGMGHHGCVGTRILAVEDDERIRSAVKLALEDEGWIVCYGYRPETDRSQLLVLDAQELELVARVELPTRVPHGFHGIWVPA